MQHEFAFVQGAAQVGQELGALQQLMGHGRVIKRDAPPPIGLGLVHGQLRLLEQFFPRGLLAQEQGHAGTGAPFKVPHGSGSTGGQCRDGLQQVFGQLLDGEGGTAGVGMLVSEHHHELITPQAGQGVRFTQGGPQGRGHGAQHLVPQFVARRIVQGREMVQIDQDDGSTGMVARAGALGLLQPVEQEGAVGQAGQLVVGGEVCNPLLAHLQGLAVRLHPFTKLLTVGFQVLLVGHQGDLCAADDYPLKRKKRQQHTRHQGQNFPARAVDIGQQVGDLLVQLKDRHHLSVMQHRNVAGDQIQVAAHPFKGTELVAVGQFAGHFPPLCPLETGVARFVFPDLPGLRGEDREPLGRVDLDLGDVGILQQRRQLRDQRAHLPALCQLVRGQRVGQVGNRFDPGGQHVLQHAGGQHVAVLGQVLHLPHLQGVHRPRQGSTGHSHQDQ